MNIYVLHILTFVFLKRNGVCEKYSRNKSRSEKGDAPTSVFHNKLAIQPNTCSVKGWEFVSVSAKGI